MKHINFTSSILKATTIAFAVALAFGFAGINKAEAAASSSYIVDITGQGCGNNCAAFYQYLASQGISVTSTTNNNTSNNGSSTATTTPNTNPSNGISPYPYYTYKNFASTDAYYKATTSPMYNYVQYPTTTYAYYQNPGSKYDSYLAGEYPERFYVYYGQDAAKQLSKYKKASTPASSYSNKPSMGSNNLGFTLTSVK